jgi:amino acid adenylation domain-containing protein
MFYPEDNSIRTILKYYAERIPDDPALIFGNRTLSWSQIDRMSNQLAHELVTCGVKPSMLVGVSMKRGIESILAILGITKIGAGYVPLSPEYPKNRIEFMARDAHLFTIITQSEFKNKLLNLSLPEVIMDEGWSSIYPEDQCPSARKPDQEDLAYILYTSGSTGIPKGVMISHRSLEHFIDVVTRSLKGNRNDRYLLSAPLHYALSVRQLFIPLSQGASLVIADENQVKDPVLFLKSVKANRVTRMDIVPSYWKMIVELLETMSPQSRSELLDNNLKQIVSVGEPLPVSIPETWAHRLGHRARLINIFGQTETTGIVSFYEIPKHIPSNYKNVPIGLPVEQTQIHILNEHLVPVSSGEVGEICIASPCLACGYLNNQELSNSQFIRSRELDQSIYRTGDLGRFLKDGNLEHYGRIDRQIKIRGQRLEIGDIEAAMLRLPSILNCVVLAQKSSYGEYVLTAFYVQGTGRDVSTEMLKRHLEKELPEYMIPSLFQKIDALPYLSSGKVDHLALRERSKKIFALAEQKQPVREDPENWLYRPVWERESAHGPRKIPGSATWIVFTAPDTPNDNLCTELIKRGSKVIRVIEGPKYKKRKADLFELNPEKENDCDYLFQELSAQTLLPCNILFLAGCTAVNSTGRYPLTQEALNKVQQHIFFGYIRLVQSLASLNTDNQIQLGVVTCYAHSIHEEDPHHPEYALLDGAVRTTSLEYPEIRMVGIDIDDTPDASSNVIDELLYASTDTTVAYRKGVRYALSYKRAPLAESGRECIKIRHGGVYLVTGGLGDIGLIIADYLSSFYKAHVILLGRSFFPHKKNWKAWLLENDEINPITQKIRAIQAMEQKGGTVSLFMADTAESAQMKDAIDQIIEDHGCIHGVFHAAGVRGRYNPLENNVVHSYFDVLKPKVTGTYVLSKHLAHRNPDFLILFSSISSILGRIGQVDYCAANSFLDSFAAYFQETTGIRSLSINWDTWQDTGLSSSENMSLELKTLMRNELKYAISPEEGIDVLQKLLISAETQLIVSTRDLAQRIRTSTFKTKQCAPALRKTSIIPPTSHVERHLEIIWSELMQLNEVGVTENFFQLGGNSLMAVRLFVRISKMFKVDLPIAALFENPTIQELACVLERKLKNKDAIPTGETNSSSCIQTIKRGGERPALFCVHALGGNTLSYHALSQRLRNDQPVYGIQALAVNETNVFHTTIEEMAEHYISEMCKIQPTGPYYICGLSFGGLVAFEIGCQLMKKNLETGGIFLLDSYCNFDHLFSSRDKMKFVVKRWFSRINGNTRTLTNNSFRENIGYLGKKWKTIKRKTSNRLWQFRSKNFINKHLSLPDHLKEISNRNIASVRKFRPMPHPVNITLFKASESRFGNYYDEETYHWKLLALGGVELITVPGNHLTILDEPNVQVLANHMQLKLDAAVENQVRVIQKELSVINI